QYKHIKVDRKFIFIGILVLFSSFFINIWSLIFLSFFCVINAVLLSLDRYIQMPIDIEVSTFSAVLMTSVYGLKWGIAVAILTKVVAILYTKIVRVDHFFMMGGYVIAAVLANKFAGLNIIVLGIIVTLLTNVYVVFVSKFITMLSNYEIIMYGTSNFIFNVVLFVGFADLFKLIMI
ncbi:MAG: hypothetical protein AABW92_01195, partial [Nanoarchaeota archaeon]